MRSSFPKLKVVGMCKHEAFYSSQDNSSVAAIENLNKQRELSSECTSSTEGSSCEMSPDSQPSRNCKPNSVVGHDAQLGCGLGVGQPISKKVHLTEERAENALIPTLTSVSALPCQNLCASNAGSCGSHSDTERVVIERHKREHVLVSLNGDDVQQPYKRAEYSQPFGLSATASDSSETNNPGMLNLRVVRDSKEVYHIVKRVGGGAFGVVYLGHLISTNDTVAVKQVVQRGGYKCREYNILKQLNHPNIVQLLDGFLTYNSGLQTHILHLIMNFLPFSLSDVLQSLRKRSKFLPLVMVKQVTYQLCKALSYLHERRICHRDVKPENILIDPSTSLVQLCDFGTAKQMFSSDVLASYVCSRYYRAPELILGAVNYTEQVDVWSLGCILVEMLLGKPVFAGDSGIDHLIEIIKVMGSPTPAELHAMNPTYGEYKLPTTQSVPWSSVFGPKSDADAVDLVCRFLRFDPKMRLKPAEALEHPFFSDIKSITTLHTC